MEAKALTRNAQTVQDVLNYSLSFTVVELPEKTHIAAGTPHAVFSLKRTDLVTLTGGKVAAIIYPCCRRAVVQSYKALFCLLQISDTDGQLKRLRLS